MTLDVVLPILGSGKKKSVRDLIISILSRQWPLNAKEIYSLLQKDFSAKVSYQAAHKALTELKNENVLVKDEKSFQLNEKWISDLKNFAEILESNYLGTQGKYEIKPNFSKPLHFKFNNPNSVAITLAETFAKRTVANSEDKQGFGVARHLYWTLTSFSFRDFKLLQTVMQNNEIYYITEKDTPLDRWLKEQYVKGGVKAIKLGVNMGLVDDIFVHGDCILQITFSKETEKLLDKIYEETSNLLDLFKHYTLQAFAKQKMDIEVTITKNPQLANLLRNQMVQTYKEKTK